LAAETYSYTLLDRTRTITPLGHAAGVR
jgi:hypothetical protein